MIKGAFWCRFGLRGMAATIISLVDVEEPFDPPLVSKKIAITVR